MTIIIHMAVLFVGKMLDNMLSTAKTILIQRNRCVLASIALALSNYIYFIITKNIVTAESDLSIIVVSVASGVGCLMAMAISNRLSKERTFVNVIMSDDIVAMKQFRDFLAEHHITNVAIYSAVFTKVIAHIYTEAASIIIQTIHCSAKRFTDANKA